MRACDSISPRTERATARESCTSLLRTFRSARLLGAVACGAALWIAGVGRGGEPLARCALQSLADPNADRGATIFNRVLVQSPADNPISYRRGPVGDWLVPESVDPQDASIRVLLLTPDGPLYVRIEALIDSRPFRAITEEWIDAALARPEAAAKTVATDEAKTASAAAGAKMAKSQFQKTKVPAWLAQYVRDSAAPVERFEARWLIAQRSGGPALLELERFSSNRSAAAPLVHFLDADGDGALQAAEVGQAATRLAECDFNQDGSVDLAELERARPRKESAYRAWRAEPLLVVIDEQTDWQALAQTVQARYAGMAGAAKAPDVESLKRLVDGAAEVAVRVKFGADKESAGVELVGFESASFTDKKPRSGQDAIALAQARSDVQISAGQTAEPSGLAQVSIGAVVEGSPLWSLADFDNDNRLSIREQSGVQSMLAGLDQNGDGDLAGNEIPIRIRLAVALGPYVHTLLARHAEPIPRVPRAPRDKAPDWFASMDANGDGDLSMREFVGTRDQFVALDKNGDGLLSVKEALQVAGERPKP